MLEELWESTLDDLQVGNPIKPEELLDRHNMILERLLGYLGCKIVDDEMGWAEIHLPNHEKPLVVPRYLATLPEPKIWGTLAETADERRRFEEHGNQRLAEYLEAEAGPSGSDLQPRDDVP